MYRSPYPLPVALVLVFLASSTPGCASPSPHGASGQSTIPSHHTNGALDRIVEPPRWPEQEVSAAFQTWSDGLSRTSAESSNRAGMLMLEPSEGRVLPTSLYGRLTRGEPTHPEGGPLATIHGRLLRRAPSTEILASGEAIVRFETIRPIAGAGLYYGTQVPSDPFRQARYRRHVHELESSEDGLQHSLRADIRLLLREKYDVGLTMQTGRGIFTFRLEVLDSDSGDARVYDGVARFRCSDGACGPEADFIQTPAFPIGPFVDLVSTEAATVSVNTDVDTQAALAVVCPRGRLRVLRSEGSGRRHTFSVSNLRPDTRYGYQLWAAEANGETSRSRTASFRTAVPSGHRFSFAALSDSRSGHGAADERYGGTNRRVLHGLFLEALRHDARFAVFVGDLIDGYTSSPAAFRFELFAWQQSVRAFTPYLPIYEVMGNHESLVTLWEAGWATARLGSDGPEAIFADTFMNPTNGPTPANADAPTYLENTYSFDYGNAHLSAINTNYWFRSHPDRDGHPAGTRGQREGWVNDETLAWLEADLRAARERGMTHLFVFTHEPGFPNGGHSHDGMYWSGENPEVLARRDALFRLMSEHGVVAIIHGDEHNYSRLRVDESLIDGMQAPVWQLISGGAGAPYYAQEQHLPWSDQVAHFDSRQHVLLLDVDDDEVQLRVISLTGETIERVMLRGAAR